MNKIKIRPVGQPSAPTILVAARQGKRKDWRHWPAQAKKTALRRGYTLAGTRQQ